MTPRNESFRSRVACTIKTKATKQKSRANTEPSSKVKKRPRKTPVLAKKSQRGVERSKTRAADLETHRSILYRKLGRLKDPAKRSKIADELVQLIFGV